MNIPEAERMQENQTPCVYRDSRVFIWAIAPIGSHNSPHACVSRLAPSEVKKITDTYHEWVPLEDVQIA